MLRPALLQTSSQAGSQILGIKVAQAAHAVASGRLDREAGEGIVTSTLSELISLAENFTEQRKMVDPPPDSIKCRSGCSHCCHVRVVVTPLEALSLAEFIRETFTDDELHKLTKRLNVADSITHGMSDEEHGGAHVHCPLLVDDHCSVYQARPLECRGYVSMDVEPCRKTFENYAEWNIPMYFPQYSVYKHVQAGLIYAWQTTNVRIDLLELIAALCIALESPDVTQRWLNGEHVFQDAALSPSDPECLALQPWTPTFGNSTT